MKKILREPLFHFLIIGFSLFIFFRFTSDQTGPQYSGGSSDRIVVTSGRIDQFIVGFTRTWQRLPTDKELKGLIEDYVRDEIYYREALALGLDRDDTIVRRRMRQKLEVLTEDIAQANPPTDEELQAYLQKNPEEFRKELQIAFRHVYVNSDRRGNSAEPDAVKILQQLRSGMNPDTLGDIFLMENDVSLSRRSEISRLFGEEFAEKLIDLKPQTGKWVGPIRSGYGLHLVRISKRTEGYLPELAEIRDTVEREWQAARTKQVKDETYRQLRERYTVVVELTEKDGGEAKNPLTRKETQ
jgi:hypothetical protein